MRYIYFFLAHYSKLSMLQYIIKGKTYQKGIVSESLTLDNITCNSDVKLFSEESPMQADLL